MTQQATRHARRVYVGGLPPTANEQSVSTFFSQVMSAIGGNTAGPGIEKFIIFLSYWPQVYTKSHPFFGLLIHR
jgi:splicing factor U2AF subunit